jgi:NADH-quinone oxidoreductase subunit G
MLAPLGAHPLQCRDELDARSPARFGDDARGRLRRRSDAFRNRAVEYADALLPIAPFTETAGSFINTEGRLQSFHGVVRPLGEARPAWKVLRVLGNLMGVSGFAFDSAEAVRDEALAAGDMPARLVCRAVVGRLTCRVGSGGSSVPMSRSISPIPCACGALQRPGTLPCPASMSGALMELVGLNEGDKVRITQEGGEAVLDAARDDRIPADCVRIPAAHSLTAGLGAMSGEVQLERVPATRGVTA